MVKRRTKKAIGIVIGIIVALVLLMPFSPPEMYNDGGTVRYRAILYSVADYHSIVDEGSFLTGIEIKILGMTVYRSTKIGQ